VKDWTTDVLRTPGPRFVGLPDFPFAPHYSEVANAGGPALRIHYLDEGPQDTAPVLLLHGEPSWCYLYRRRIPPLAARGHRVLAPGVRQFPLLVPVTEAHASVTACKAAW